MWQYVTNVTNVYVDTSGIEERLDQMLERADHTISLLENPDAVAAAEKLRKGLTALRNGWNDDAVIELTASVERFAYRGLPHLLLGLATLPEDPDRTVMHFQNAVKYGVAADASAGAAGAILGAACLDRAARSEEAGELLSSASKLGTVPEAVIARIIRDPNDVAAAQTALDLMLSGQLSQTEAAAARHLLDAAHRTRLTETRAANDLVLTCINDAARLIEDLSSIDLPAWPRLDEALRDGKDVQIAGGWLGLHGHLFDDLEEAVDALSFRAKQGAQKVRQRRLAASVDDDLSVAGHTSLELANIASTTSAELSGISRLLAEVEARAAAAAEAMRSEAYLGALRETSAPARAREYAMHCDSRSRTTLELARSLTARRAHAEELLEQIAAAVRSIEPPDTAPVVRPLLDLPVALPPELSEGLTAEASRSHQGLVVLLGPDTSPQAVPVPTRYVEGRRDPRATASAAPALQRLVRKLVATRNAAGHPGAQQFLRKKSTFGNKVTPTGPMGYEVLRERVNPRFERAEQYADTRVVYITVDAEIVTVTSNLHGGPVVGRHQGVDDLDVAKAVLMLYIDAVGREVVFSVDPAILALTSWPGAFWGGGAEGDAWRRKEGRRGPYPHPWE